MISAFFTSIKIILLHVNFFFAHGFNKLHTLLTSTYTFSKIISLRDFYFIQFVSCTFVEFLCV